jgi:hypothetical protein
MDHMLENLINSCQVKKKSHLPKEPVEVYLKGTCGGRFIGGMRMG